MQGRTAVGQRAIEIKQRKAAWLASCMPESMKHGRVAKACGAEETKHC